MPSIIPVPTGTSAMRRLVVLCILVLVVGFCAVPTPVAAYESDLYFPDDPTTDADAPSARAPHLHDEQLRSNMLRDTAGVLLTAQHDGSGGAMEDGWGGLLDGGLAAAAGGEQHLAGTTVAGGMYFRAAAHRRRRRAIALAVDCTGPVNPCGQNGNCVIGTGCVCNQDTQKGFWSGTTCSECSPGYAGSQCTIECAGGSCNMCNGNGICSQGTIGDGICTCYTDISRGFWSGASCSTCRTNYFGAKCQSSCPGQDTGAACYGRGTCNPVTGTCQCITGYGTDSGCEFCDSAHYGPACSGECPGFFQLGKPCSGHGNCLNGTTFNGTCICDPFYGADDCSKLCPNLCTGDRGDCDDGTQGTGTCACDANFASPDCQYCVDNKTSSECTVDCRVNRTTGLTCNNRGKCYYDEDRRTAMCLCQLGYNGTFCEFACAGDPPCSGHGNCVVQYNALGNVTSGVCDCVRSNATGFWTGATCSTCMELYNNSINCAQPCPLSKGYDVCGNHGFCANGTCFCNRNDPVTANDYCSSDCSKFSAPQLGFNDPLAVCNAWLCPQLFQFSPTCAQTCPGTLGDTVCSGHGRCDEGKLSATGLCFCEFSHSGSDCSLACPVNRITRLACSGFTKGTCTFRTMPSTGLEEAYCLCRYGFTGSTCELECPSVAGVVCNNNGQCLSNGRCSCGAGYAGKYCNVPCVCNPDHGYCNQVACFNHSASSVCDVCQCEGNFTGRCYLCRNGTQGSSCEGTCVNGRTSTVSKDCICDEFWSTASCTVPCPRGGANGTEVCSGNGTCSWGSRLRGTCSCVNSYYSADCSVYCTPMLCRATLGLRNPQCNRLTGQCECLQDVGGGYWGPEGTCDRCKFGFWGSFCTEVCDCSGNGACDAQIGTCFCFDDAENGFFTGTTCSSCQKGFTGAQCLTPEVQITRANVEFSGVSGTFLFASNITAAGLAPTAVVATVDEFNFRKLFVGGRPVALIDIKGSQVTMQTSTGYYPELFATTQFGNKSCGAQGDVALVIVTRQRLYFVMQPIPNCSVPMRLVPIVREYQSNTFRNATPAPFFLHVTTNNTGGTVEFNNMVRITSAKALTTSETQLVFTVAQTFLDPNNLERPHAGGYLVYVDVDQLMQNIRGVVWSLELPAMVMLDCDISPFIARTIPQMLGVSGFIPTLTSSVWELRVFFLAGLIRPVYTGSNQDTGSIRPMTLCWPLFISNSLPESQTLQNCSYCLSAPKMAFDGYSIITSITTENDTIVAWIQRAQNYPNDPSVVFAAPVNNFCQPSTVTAPALATTFAVQGQVSQTSVSIPACGPTDPCTEAFLFVTVSQTSAVSSAATAIAFDVLSRVAFVAMSVNNGLAPSILAKYSINMSSFGTYGVLPLGYVSSSSGQTRAEIIRALVIAPVSRLLYAGISGIAVLKVACFLLYEVGALVPDIADQRGSTPITIRGRGFVQVTDAALVPFLPKCVFGNQFIDAEIISSTEARCLAPPQSDRESSLSCGLQLVEFTLYQSYFTTANLNQIQRVSSAVILSSVPEHGTMFNSTAVTIAGAGFQDSIYSVCRFNSSSPLSTQSLITRVQYISSNKIVCIQPRAFEASYDRSLLDVSLDGYLYTIQGPITYEIVGEPTGIQSDTPIIRLQAREFTRFAVNMYIVDERLHDLGYLDLAERTVLLLMNVTYNSDCSLRRWMPQHNCIPYFPLVDDIYPNASFIEDDVTLTQTLPGMPGAPPRRIDKVRSQVQSLYSKNVCRQPTLNEIATPYANWTVNTTSYYWNDTSRQSKWGNALALKQVSVIGSGNVTFDDLYFYAPRTSTITLTFLVPEKGWRANVVVIISEGAPYALAIGNILEFRRFVTGMNVSVCPLSLDSGFKYPIIQNSLVPPITIFVIDRMANQIVDTETLNDFFVEGDSYRIDDDGDLSKVPVPGNKPQPPVLRDSGFSFTGVTMQYMHGASHFIEFSATPALLPTTTPPMRTKQCSGKALEYKVPLSSECLKCPPVGAICNGSEFLEVELGYWRAPNTTTGIYKCTVPGVCIGANESNKGSQCKMGYRGPLCNLCIDLYGKSGTNCVPCDSFGQTFVQLAFAIVAVILVLVAWTVVTLRNAETTEMSIIMRTVVNHMQSAGQTGQFSKEYAPFMQSLITFQSSGSSMSISGLQSLDCMLRYTDSNWTAVFALYMGLPFLSIILALLGFAVVRLLKLKPVLNNALKLEIEQDILNFGENAKSKVLLEKYPFYMVFVTTVCVVMFSVFQTIIQQCTNALLCQAFMVDGNEYDPTPVTKQFLIVDMSIECFPTSGGLFPYSTILTTPALMFLIVYGFGIPLGFTMGYRVLNDRLGMPELTKLMFMFLCGGYKDHLYFWQSLIMVRKLVLVMATVFLGNSPQTLNYVAMWIMSLSLVLQVWLQPCIQDIHNFIESVSLAVITLTLNLGLLYFWSGLPDFGKTVLTCVLIVITLGVFLMFVRYIAPALWKDIGPMVMGIIDVITKIRRVGISAFVAEMLKDDETKKRWKRRDRQANLAELEYTEEDNHGTSQMFSQMQFRNAMRSNTGFDTGEVDQGAFSDVSDDDAVDTATEVAMQARKQLQEQHADDEYSGTDVFAPPPPGAARAGGGQGGYTGRMGVAHQQQPRFEVDVDDL